MDLVERSPFLCRWSRLGPRDIHENHAEGSDSPRRGSEAILLRCLRKKRDDRYPSMSALAKDLRAAASA